MLRRGLPARSRRYCAVNLQRMIFRVLSVVATVVLISFVIAKNKRFFVRLILSLPLFRRLGLNIDLMRLTRSLVYGPMPSRIGRGRIGCGRPSLRHNLCLPDARTARLRGL